MRIRVFILASTIFALSACATSTELREKYAAMDCDALSKVAENYERTNWIDQVDLYNDYARQDERRASDSPWRDKSEGKRDDHNDIRNERDAIRAAYHKKRCTG